jgi:hypothetical protein
MAPNHAVFQNTNGYNLLYLVGSEPMLSTWGGKQAYEVRITKSLTQTSNILVHAHSPAEAENLARQTPNADLEWTEEAPAIREYLVVSN